MPPELLNDCQAVRQAAWLLFRWLTALTAVDAQRPRPRPSPSPSVHKPLRHLSFESPEEPKRCHETGLLEARLRVRACSLAHLYGRDATVNVCFATVRFHFPAQPQSAAPAHTGPRAWGAVGLFTRGPLAKVSAAPESSRLPGLQTGSLAGPGHCRGKAGWGRRLSSGRGWEGPSPDGPRTEGREGLPGQACP